MIESIGTAESLGERIARRYEHALKRKAVLPLQTHTETLASGKAHFVVKCISALSVKDMVSVRQRAQGDDPFLPYDPDLFVADLSPSHVLLLNKFPMERVHTLAVTRRFAQQTAPLDYTDFHAAATLLLNADGLVAYNGGKLAGASQPHRHLHFVAHASAAPLQVLFPLDGPAGAIDQVDAFAFVHAFIRLHDSACDVPSFSEHLQRAYEDACRFCGLAPVGEELPAYNLLVTRRWMLLVPRSQECWSSDGESMSLNAFSYGGVLAVRNARQMELLAAAGPWSVLQAISRPKP